jgi:hypothetical protein
VMEDQETTWRCLFEDENGRVLIGQDAFEGPEEAVIWGQEVLAEPEEYELLDPNGLPVSADEADGEAGFTIEDSEGNQADPDPWILDD